MLVYPGADGRFSLYEDDGRSTGYKQGAFSRIPISYDDRSGTVRFGKREGAGWEGMPATRTLRVRWVIPGQAGKGDAFDAEVSYTGQAIDVAKRQR